MIILNAIASGGAIFGAEGNLIHPEWPENGYLRCSSTADQELFRFLEEARWSNGNVLATARWYERQNDDSSINPRWTVGSICFRGSGVHFHFYDYNYNVSQSNLHFLCEVPWEDTFDKKDGQFTFVGGERFRKAFLDRIEKQQVICESRLHRLQFDLTSLSARFGRLRQATKGSF